MKIGQSKKTFLSAFRVRAFGEIDNYPSGVGPEALGAPALQEQTRDPIPPLRADFVEMDAATTRT